MATSIRHFGRKMVSWIWKGCLAISWEKMVDLERAKIVLLNENKRVRCCAAGEEICDGQYNYYTI